MVVNIFLPIGQASSVKIQSLGLSEETEFESVDKHVSEENHQLLDGSTGSIDELGVTRLEAERAKQASERALNDALRNHVLRNGSVSREQLFNAVDSKVGLKETESWKYLSFDESLIPINNSNKAKSTVTSNYIEEDLEMLQRSSMSFSGQEDSCSVLGYSTAATVMSTISSTQEPESPYIKPVERMNEAPYSMALYNESVSKLSGDLTVQASEFTLPGRGGLSFTLTRTYNSSASQFDEMDTTPLYAHGFCYSIIKINNSTSAFIGEEKKSFDGLISTTAAIEIFDFMRNGGWDEVIDGIKYIYRPITNRNHVSRHVGYTNINTTDQLENRFPIGKGWSWNIPFVKEEKGKKYIGLGDGSVYEIVNGKLKNYPWSDLSYVYDNSVTYGSIRSVAALKSTTGTNYYFDGSGYLIQIKDIHNNTISFSYASVEPYGKVLTKIEDVIDNKIEISYTGNEVILTSGDRTITYEKSTYEYENYDKHKMINGATQQPKGYKEILSSVTDPKDRVTTYSYEYSMAKYNVMGSTLSIFDKNPYMLLTSVHHPTGVVTTYNYEPIPVTRYIGDNQVKEVYRIASRYDRVNYSNPQQPYQDFNYAALVYSSDMATSHTASYSFSTTLFTGLLEMKETFDKVYASSQNTYYLTSKEISDKETANSEVIYVENYSYDRAKKRTIPISTSSYYKKLPSGATTVPVTSSKTFDDYKNITSFTNEHGVVSTYSYDPTSKRLINATEPASNEEKIYTIYTRNNKGNITSIVQKANNNNGPILNLTNYDYDTHGNLTYVGKSKGEPHGDSGFAETFIQYSQAYDYAYPTRIRNPYTDVDGNVGEHVVEATYNKSRGTIASYTDGNGQITSYTYDKLDRLITQSNPPTIRQNLSTNTTTSLPSSIAINYNDITNEVIVTNEDQVKTYTKWNPLGLEIEQGFIVANNTKSARSKMGYDLYSRLSWSEDGAGNRTNYYYNNVNELVTQILPNGTQSNTVYDRMNATVQTTDVEGKTQVDSYDRFGRVIKNQLVDNQNLVTVWTGQYNNANLLVTARDSKNQLTEYVYDIKGNLEQVDTPDQQSNHYDYNSLGQLILKHSPNGDTQQYIYDELGRLIKKIDSAQQSEKYYYDGNHQVTAYVDQKGQQFTYTYNRGRLLTQSVTMQSSQTGEVESIHYNYSLAGLRTGMKDNGDRITSYSYDQYTSELEQITYPDGQTIQYGYYGNGVRANMITPFGDQVDYRYEGEHAGRLVEVKWNGVNQATYQYYQNGPLEYQQQANGLKTQYTYDNFNRIDLISYLQNTTNLITLDYGYDNNHNILSIQETAYNSLPSIKNYVYDVRNRIEVVEESPTTNEFYGYDPNGNRETLVMVGKELNIKEAIYEYDQWNRLTKAQVKNLETSDPNDWKVVEYVYNGDHLMVERKEDGVTTRYYYDGANIIAEGTVSSNGTVVPKASYLYGTQGLIMSEDESSMNKDKFYYVMNGHGDVFELRNSLGDVVQSYTYDLWGNPEATNSGITQPFLYSGEYWDATIGLQYLRARWYDPSVGRFITKDTYEGELNNPLTLNLYTYVHNNPLRYIDPSGHDAIIITANHAAFGNGHTSALFQDKQGNWYYTYWGDKGVIVKETKEFTSLDGFNNWLNQQDFKEWSTTGYTSSTYIAGDFTDSLGYFKELVENFNGTMGTKNDDYNVFLMNCLQMTMKALEKGKLNDGTKVSSIMGYDSIRANTIPNSAKVVFEANFNNNAFRKNEYIDQLQSLLDSYNTNWFTRFFYSSNIDKVESLLSK